MKRALFLKFMTIFALFAATAAQAFDTAARNAYVIDVATNTVMLDKNSQEPIPPASTSKLMTIALLFKALEEGRVSMDTKFSISEKSWSMGGSKMFLEIGQQVTVEDLIQGIIVQSGNDACVAVAEGLSGSEEAFVREMNAYAQELGMTNSSFGNSSGWPDPRQRMSARDLANLANYLYNQYPQYWHYFSETEFTFNEITQANRNPLLGTVAGADGLKTGHTQEAGYSLVASIERGNRRIMLVLMGLDSEAARKSEAERVATWALEQFQQQSFYKAGDEVMKARTWLAEKDEIALTTASDFSPLALAGTLDGAKATANITEPLKAPLPAGTAVGELVFEREDLPPYKVELVTLEPLERGNFLSRYVSVLGSTIQNQISKAN